MAREEFSKPENDAPTTEKSTIDAAKEIEKKYDIQLDYNNLLSNN